MIFPGYVSYDYTYHYTYHDIKLVISPHISWYFHIFLGWIATFWDSWSGIFPPVFQFLRSPVCHHIWGWWWPWASSGWCPSVTTDRKTMGKHGDFVQGIKHGDFIVDIWGRYEWDLLNMGDFWMGCSWTFHGISWADIVVYNQQQSRFGWCLRMCFFPHKWQFFIGNLMIHLCMTWDFPRISESQSHSQ